MSDQHPTDSTQNRRRFLQLLGASGVATGTLGTNAAADHRSSGPQVDLFTFAEDFCDRGRCADNVDYLLPLGSDAEFQAQIDGDVSQIDVKKKNLDTGETDTIASCGEAQTFSHRGGDCEQFDVEFDEEGTFEIRVEAWSEDGLVGEPLGGFSGLGGITTFGGGHGGGHDDGHDDHDHGGNEQLDCSELDDLGCDSIVCEIVEPDVGLDVEGFDGGEPWSVGDTLILTADVDPAIEPDDWTLDTARVDDEPSEVPEIEAPPAGEVWARRPIQKGTYIATATCEYGTEEFSQSVEIEVGNEGEFSFSDAEITHDHHDISASIDLSNDSDDFKTADVELKTFGNGQETIDSDEVGVLPGEQETVELEGDLPEDAFYAVLELNGESVESREL